MVLKLFQLEKLYSFFKKSVTVHGNEVAIKLSVE